MTDLALTQIDAARNAQKIASTIVAGMAAKASLSSNTTIDTNLIFTSTMTVSDESGITSSSGDAA